MPDELRISHRLTLPGDSLEESFIAASGPGGQNVNKVATAVQLRFDPARAPGLTEAVLGRLRAAAGQRLNNDGTILISAREHRTQERNREAAREKLAALLREALVAPIKRRPTRPTRASQERRLTAKRTRSRHKEGRGAVRDD